jgi:hypothetical protein
MHTAPRQMQLPSCPTRDRMLLSGELDLHASQGRNWAVYPTNSHALWLPRQETLQHCGVPELVGDIGDAFEQFHALYQRSAVRWVPKNTDLSHASVHQYCVNRLLCARCILPSFSQCRETPLGCVIRWEATQELRRGLGQLSCSQCPEA